MASAWDELNLGTRPVNLEENKVSRGRSLASAPIKGLIKGGESLYPLEEDHSRIGDYLLRKLGLAQGEEQPSTLEEALQRMRTGKQERLEAIEKYLPTQDRPEEELLQRLGSAFAVPIPAGGPVSTIARAGGSALLEQTAKEVGAPPWLQGIAGFPAYLAPNLPARVAVARGNEPILNTMREMGFSENAITRSIQTEGKLARVAPFALKGQRATTAVRETQNELGNFYQGMRNSQAAQEVVDPQIIQGLLGEWTNILRDMPHAVRNSIAPEFRQLLSAPVTPNSMMRFWRQINQVFQGQRQQLQHLKTPMQDVLYSTNPELAQQFEIWNNMYSNLSNLRRQLTPSLRDELFFMTEAVPVAQAAVQGNPSKLFAALKALGWISGARKLAQEALISPRLQGIGRKFLQTATEGSIGNTARLAKNLRQAFEEEEGIKEGVQLPRIMSFD